MPDGALSMPSAADAADPRDGRADAGPPLLLNARRAAALCGLSPATWYRLASAGRIPAPIRLSGGCVRWRADELRLWVEYGCPSRKEFEARRAAAGGRK